MNFLPTLAHATVVHPEWSPMVNGLVMFWALLLGHALADFPLQGEFLAVGKDRHANLSQVTGGKAWPPSIWLYCLTVHALIQSAAVWIVTGSVVLCLVEFVLHWFIDWAKSEELTNFYSDQCLHIVCKAIYAGLFMAGIHLP